MVTLLLKTQGELANSPYPLLTLEMSLVRLATLARGQDLGKLITRLEGLEKRLAGGLAPASPAPSRPAASAPSPAPGGPPPKKPEAPAAAAPGNKGWQGLVDQVKQSRPMLGSVLEHGRPLNLEPPRLEIGYPKGSFMLEQFKDGESCQAIEELASVYFDHPVTLKVVTVDAQQAGSPQSLVETRHAEETDRMRRLKEDALNHPALKAVQDVFEGEIKKVIPIDKGFV